MEMLIYSNQHESILLTALIFAVFPCPREAGEHSSALPQVICRGNGILIKKTGLRDSMRFVIIFLLADTRLTGSEA